jgi:hypothetical protein
MNRLCSAGGVVLALIVAAGCVSSSKMLRNRQYDMAIAHAVKKLSNDSGDKEEIEVLAKAYKLANEADNERIKFLKQSNEPQIWEDVYALYNRLKSRQELVKPLDPLVLQAINYVYVDYDQDLIDAKHSAADYLFGQGKKLLAKNNRFDARGAYDYFTKVKEYMPSYSGIDDKINEAYGRGLTYIYLKIKNASNAALPRAFEDDLCKISFENCRSLWLVFDSRYDAKTKYDYAVILNLRKIEVSPELMASSDFAESKEAEDGWEYVLDARGNVTKDSLGDDVKKTKYKTLKCFVTKFSLGKTAMVAGTLDFINAATGQMVKTDPVSAESKFEFAYATFKGDKEALSAATRKLTELKIEPFPSNEDLVFRTSERLKQLTKDIISTNLRLLQ